MGRKPNLFLDVKPRSSVAASVVKSSVELAASQWVTGRVVDVLADADGAPNGWVEVEVPADNPQSHATGPVDGGYAQVGSLVRVLRDAEGRIQKITEPQAVDTSVGASPVVATGFPSARLDAAMSKAVDAFTAADEVRGRAAAAAASAESALTSANAALKAAENAVGTVFSADEPVDPPDSLVWYVLNTDGQVTGVKVRVSGAWVDRPLVGGSVLVPSSVGTVSIQDGAVTAPKVYASQELWSKLAVFDEAVIDKLYAQGATIKGDLLADTINGKTITGATIVGPTIKTDTHADTGIVLDASGIRLYNSASHQQTGLISAGTGQIKVANSDGNLISLSDMVFGMEVFQSTDDVAVVKPSSGGAATGPWTSVNMFTWNAVSKQVYVIVSALDRMIFSGGRQKNPPVMANMTLVDNSNGWTKDIGTTVGGGPTKIPANIQDSVNTHPVLMGQYGNLTIGKSYTIRIGFRSFNTGWDSGYYSSLSAAQINPITAFKFIG